MTKLAVGARIARLHGLSTVRAMQRSTGPVPFRREGATYYLANDASVAYHLKHSIEKIARLAETVTATDRVVLDVGAHSGLFAAFVKARHPTCRVICVEPDATLHATIRHNMTGRDPWDLVAAAIGAAPGSATLYRNPESTQTNSLIRQSVDMFGTSEPIAVEVLTLDGLLDMFSLDRIDVLKIDIQGGETAAFDGGQRALAITQKVLAEVSFLDPDPAGLLRRLAQFTWEPLNDVHMGADLLFRR